MSIKYMQEVYWHEYKVCKKYTDMSIKYMQEVYWHQYKVYARSILTQVKLHARSILT